MNRRSFLSFLAPLPILPLLPMLKLTRTTNPMEFQKGQKVVCVDSEPHLHPGIWSRSKPTPICGKIYTVEEGFEVSNGSYWVTLKELTNPGHLCCFPNWRFRPIAS
jgi:hypothetical protein